MLMLHILIITLVLGAVYHAKGEIDQAKDYYERALATREKH
jgi:Tfp pilus assembly protein PilF